MKHLIAFTLLIASLYCSAQIGMGKSSNNGVDTVRKEILMIPFKLEMYMNDADIYLAEESDKNFYQVRNFIRLRLDQILTETLSKKHNVTSLGSSSTMGVDEDLYMIYGASGFFYADTSNTKKDKLNAKFNKLKASLKNKNQTTGMQRSQIGSPITDISDKFLNVRFSDKEVIMNTSRKYQNEIYLLINQFEIKGDYSDPYKVANKSYDRKIIVHYSIYNKRGMFIYGNMVIQKFPAMENNVEEIAEKYFPQIARTILQKL